MDFSTLLGLVPQSYALYVALVIIACKIATVLVRPPATGSRWVPVYQVVTMIALNIGWATNRLQIGKTGVMVARDQAEVARATLSTNGIPVLPGTK